MFKNTQNPNDVNIRYAYNMLLNQRYIPRYIREITVLIEEKGANDDMIKVLKNWQEYVVEFTQLEKLTSKMYQFYENREPMKPYGSRNFLLTSILKKVVDVYLKEHGIPYTIPFEEEIDQFFYPRQLARLDYKNHPEVMDICKIYRNTLKELEDECKTPEEKFRDWQKKRAVKKMQNYKRNNKLFLTNHENSQVMPTKKRRNEMTPEELAAIRQRDREQKRKSRKRISEKSTRERSRQPCRKTKSTGEIEVDQPSTSSTQKRLSLPNFDSDSDSDSSDKYDENSSTKRRKTVLQRKRRQRKKESATDGNERALLNLKKERDANTEGHARRRNLLKESATDGNEQALLNLKEERDANTRDHARRRNLLKESANDGDGQSVLSLEIELDTNARNQTRRRNLRKELANDGNEKALKTISEIKTNDRARHQQKRMTVRKDQSLPSAHYLGKMIYECRYCHALHFPGEQRCCHGGTVFIPPERKMPKVLHKLLYDINNPLRKPFQDEILKYNSLFAFGSIQFHRVTQAKHGVQTVKTLGNIRHFTSAVFPNQKNHPLFGNFYTFDHVSAAEYRTETPLSKGLEKKIIVNLSEMFESCHPFSQFYKNMKQVIEEAKQNGEETKRIRMRIVDFFEFERRNLDAELQGTHRGVYSTSTCGDFVSLYTTTDVDQNILPMGVNVYQKLGPHIPRSLFSYRREVDSFCYPILAPYGECGFKERTWKHQTRMPFEERLENFIAEDDKNEHLQWDIVPSDEQETDEDSDDEHKEDQNERNERRSIEDIDYEDEEGGEEEEFVDIEDDNFDNEYEKTIEIRDPNEEDTTNLDFEFRNGEAYPVRKRTEDINLEWHSDSDHDDLNLPAVDFPSVDDLYLLDGEVDNEIEDNTSLENNEVENDDNEDNNEETEEDEMNRKLNPDMAEAEGEHEKKGLYTSRLQYLLYRAQRRRKFRNRISSCGKLGQLYIMDQFSRVIQNRMYHIREHHTQTMRSTRKKLLLAYQAKANRKKTGLTIGAITSVPATVMGSPRYMRKKFEDAVAMANQLGNPTIFLTFTASSQWKEIKETLKKESWANNPFVVCELFKKKYEKLLEVVIGKPRSKGSKDRSKGLWGKVNWYTFSVEFQQRGPPHIHLLLRLDKPPKTGDDIDKICSAVLPVVPPVDDPNYAKIKRLRELVEMHHVHRPCEDDPQAYCNIGRQKSWKQCKKRFPKEFKSHTELGDKKYPDLKRPDNGEYCEKKVNGKTFKADNRYVVAYNEILLSLFECHCNVEIVTSKDALKYLFKYVFKGFDRVLLETIAPDGSSYGASGQMTQSGHLLHPKSLKLSKGVQLEREQDAIKLLQKEGVPLRDEKGRKTAVYDETTLIEDMRAFTATEAAWHLSGYRITGGSHNITNVFVHTPSEEPVYFKPGDEDIIVQKEEEEFKTALKAWFVINGDNGDSGMKARELTFAEMPKYFSYQKGKWVLRRKDWSRHIIGHIKSVHPRNLEQFAIRLLAGVVKGPTSFEELRTIDGIVFDTFVAAAKELRLMNDQVEWNRAIKEAAGTEPPIVIRRLFISILVFNAPSNPLELWLENKNEMFEHNTWPEEKKEAHALRHIQSGLLAHGLNLSQFELPEVQIGNLPNSDDWQNDNGEEDWTPEQHEDIAKKQYDKLNEDQKSAMDTIWNDLETNRNKSYFLHGSGGTGKTFLYRALYHRLRAKGMNVLCTAHTGIAATLLPNGQTSHRAFSLPLLVGDPTHSNVEFDSSWADRLREIDVVIFDEATMVDKRILAAIHEVFVNLHPENQGMTFGGVSFLFGGDWRQTLPIIDGIRDQGVLDYTIQRSDTWKKLKLLPLRKNERASADPEYAQWLQKIGNGEGYVDKKWQLIELPKQILAKSEQEVLTWVFGRNRINNPATSDYSCVLTVDNRTTEELNDKALDYIKKEAVCYKSTDTYDPKSGLEALPPETYNSMLPSGMPPHLLNLKVGCVVILIRNLNVNIGLCNGTRMRVVELGKDIIKCQPITKTSKTPDIVVLSRLEMSSAKPSKSNLSFIRNQFPVRVAHSMTINKSQGQTLDRVGVILRTPVFSHGQLYVALSRVRRFSDIKVFVHNEEDPAVTRNVVFHEILL